MNPLYEDLIQVLKQGGYLTTPELIEAFRAIDRKDFVPEELKEDAYINIPLPIGSDQMISQPLVVACMLELLSPKPGEHILEIGTGSGWQTAILAHLVGSVNAAKPRGKSKAPQVISIERVPELQEIARRNLSSYSFLTKNVVQLCTADGSKGWGKGAPYDKIIAGASAQSEIPKEWRAQLKIGGRIVAPVQHSIVVEDKVGPDDFEKKEHFGFTFVPLIEE